MSEDKLTKKNWPQSNNKLVSKSISSIEAENLESSMSKSQQLNRHQTKSINIRNEHIIDDNNDADEDNKVRVQDVKVSNIIGDFGPYQISVVIFAALRAMCCAMDGLSGPFISPNVKNFQCEQCDISLTSNDRNNSTEGECLIYLGDSFKTRYYLDSTHCYFSNADSLRPDRVTCNKWTFNNTENEKLMNSLTIEQSLVCDREWLKSLSNSMYFVGATFGLLFWGVISDRYGRRTAYVFSHFVTLIFGFSALFAESMCTFILLRSINAFGMIGELIPRSIQVEIVATEYRFVCSVICQIGWAIGIILVPALAYYNSSYRFILSFPVIISAIMLPWLFWLPESARWLITNQNYSKARNELRKAAKINGKLTDDIDGKIEQFNRQVLREEIGFKPAHKRIGIGRSILAIFTNMNLFKDTMSVFVLLFVAEVVYFSLTLNVADLSGSLYVNYVISGFSELISIAFCAVLLAYLSRRMCLSLLLLASTVSYLFMALVNVYEDSLSMTSILAVNAFGKLTAIGNLMVIILVSQEVFPTVIRQFGTSLCITVGKAGSAVAPFTHELGQIIGQSYCFAMFSIICLTCAIIPFGLSETGNRELPDTVIDVEENSNNVNNKKGKLKKNRLANAKHIEDSYHLNSNGIKVNSYISHNELNKQTNETKIEPQQTNLDSNNNYSIDNYTTLSKQNDKNMDLAFFSNPSKSTNPINMNNLFTTQDLSNDDENNNQSITKDQEEQK